MALMQAPIAALLAITVNATLIKLCDNPSEVEFGRGFCTHKATSELTSNPEVELKIDSPEQGSIH